MDYNLIDSTATYICRLGTQTISYTTLAQWQALGRGLNSVFGDPLFTDPANLDFSIPSNSPACGAASDGSDIGAIPCS